MAILRNVAKTDTLEIQRQKINQIASDLFTVQTSVGEGAFSMSDGTVQQPSLFFTNATDVGVFRGSSGKQLFIAAEGSAIAKFDKNNLTSLKDFKTLISAVPNGANGITITNPGSQYSSGTFSSVPLTGGSGTGIKASLIVRAITGNITNGGSGYVGGSYVSVPLTGGSGTGATADITVSPFSGSIQTGGSGGNIGGNASQIFTNVSLTGGSGSGMRADITVTTAGQIVAVTAVNIVNQGSGYQTGDVLTALSNTIGGVTGFQYVINGVGNVTQVQILLANTGYQVGNVLSASNTNLGGSGSGFQFTVTGVGSVIDASVTDGGDGYIIGDQLSVNAVELTPAETWYVRMWMTQLFVFSGTLPTTGFNVGDTLTYAGEGRTVVKKWLNAQNRVEAVAVRAGAEDGNTIEFFPGLSASDGNGNSATVGSSRSELNYYFSSNQNGPFENIKDFTFQKNKRYIFNQTHPSNNTHPIRFSTTADGIHTVLSGQGAQRDFGDLYEGSEVNYEYTPFDVSIIPNDNTPTTLYYYCGNGFGDPENQHINEGGFDGREGKITISGTATVSGSGLTITIGAVNTASNIILKKNGESTLGATTASSLTLTGELSVGSATTLIGNLNIGYNKFSVASSSGNTSIAGSLTVQGSLSFLADAAFGGTLYVDSTNNRVSINLDPNVNPLTYDFEVSGEAKVNDNVRLATDSSAFVRIGSGLTGTDKLQVSGNILCSDGKYLAPPTSDVLNPVYTFSGNTRVGLLLNNTNNSMSVTGLSGEILNLQKNLITTYRKINCDYVTVNSSKITIPGSGYAAGSYGGVLASGGTGSGLVANLIVSFYLPLGEINTVGNVSAADSTRVAGTYNITSANYTTNGSGTGATFQIVVDGSGACVVTVTNGGEGYTVGDTITVSGSILSPGALTPASNLTFIAAGFTSDQGSGYTDGTYTSVPLTGGSGTGAIAEIVISAGSVTSIVVTENGINYAINDTLSFNHTSLIPPLGGTSVAPSVAASLKIRYLGTLSKVTIVDFGEGYKQNDILEFPSIGGTQAVTAKYTILSTSSTTNVEINNSDGSILAKSLRTTGSGILIDNNLSIDSNIISSTQNEDIFVAPGSSSKLLSVSGTGGIKLPVGNSTNRPSAATAGIIRYNTQTSQYEGSNGINFISLGGVRDVDGNTFIIAEETVGENDNTLYFFNDGYNSARFKRTEVELVTANKISVRDTDGKLLWKPTTAFSLNAFVYYEDNIYQVTTAGTTGTIAPTHTSGSDSNGSATLTYVSDSYGSLEIRGDEIKLGTRVNIDNKLDIYAYNTNNLIFESALNIAKIAFGNNLGVPDTLVSFNSTNAAVQINRNFDTSNPEDNISLVDKTLKFLELTDVRYETTSVGLVKGASNIATSTVYNPTVHSSAKIIVTAHNLTTDDKQMIEYNVVHKNTDIFAVQYGNTVTNGDLFVGSFDFDGSNNIRFTATLASSVATGNNVKVVVTKTQIKK